MTIHITDWQEQLTHFHLDPATNRNTKTQSNLYRCV